MLSHMRGRMAITAIAFGSTVALAAGFAQGGATLAGGGFNRQLVTNVSPDDPTYVTAPSADGRRLFVVTQQGRIRLFKDGKLLPTNYLQVSVSCCGERGLLSMALAPDYVRSGLFYIYYTAPSSGDLTIDEYRRSEANLDVADPESRR